jgi:LPS-assembly protein
MLNSEKKNEFTAAGNVTLSKNIYKISADTVKYNNEKKTIYLKNRAKLTDINNNNIFAEEGIISDNMQVGEFKNAGIILNNGISIVSPMVVKNNDESYLIYEPDYYFCPNENLNIDLPYDEIINQIRKEKFQLFSIHSKRSVINKTKNKITLNHVFIKFLGVPFFYLPYVTSSRPFSTKVSGLSAPSIHHTSNYGYSVALPFRFYFFDNTDLKFEPQFYTSGNILFNTILNHNNKNDFMFNFNLKYALDNGVSKDFRNNNNVSEYEEGKYRNSRVYFDFTGRALLGNNKYFLGDINISGDNYFPRDYFGDYTTTLKSRFSILGVEPKDLNYVNFEIVSFQEIKEKTDSEILNTPHLVPNVSIFYNKNIFSNDGKQLYLGVNSEVLHIFNKNDDGYTNLKFHTNVEYDIIIGWFYVENYARIYTDAYKMYNNDNKTQNEYRIIPEFELKTTVPFSLWDGRIFVKPLVQYVLSDVKNIKNLNIDSKNSELTIGNLFSANRYSGFDLMESGNRINYGIESGVYTSFGELNFSVGQGYRDTIDNNNEIINFENNLSDILTGIYYRYDDVIFINYLNNIDSKTHNTNRQEIILESTLGVFTFNVSYVYLNNSKGVDMTTKEEQLNFYIKYNLTSRLNIDFELNNNMEFNKITLLRSGLNYEDGCFRLQFNIKKQDYIDSVEGGNVSFNLNFRVKSSAM